MTLPNPEAVGKAVAMTVLALVIINLAKPYLPAQARSLLG